MGLSQCAIHGSGAHNRETPTVQESVLYTTRPKACGLSPFAGRQTMV